MRPITSLCRSPIFIRTILGPFRQHNITGRDIRIKPPPHTPPHIAHLPTTIPRPKSTDSKNKTSSEDEDPIHSFFRKNYPTFPYDPTSHYAHEFERLRRFKNWPNRSQCASYRAEPWRFSQEDKLRHDEFEQARKEFQEAQIAAFGKDFGTRVEDLGAWVKLCVAAGVKPVPGDLKGCKKAIRASFVNLVDLHAYMRQNENIRSSTGVVLYRSDVIRPERFKNLQGLRAYTKRTEKFFPKEQAKEKGSLLRYLLRGILSHDKPKRAVVLYGSGVSSF